MVAKQILHERKLSVGNVNLGAAVDLQKASAYEVICCCSSLMKDREPDIQEWEVCLPAPEELIPLSQTLIPPVLASAFKIVYDPSCTSTSEPQLVPEKRDAPKPTGSPCFDEAAIPPPPSLQENDKMPALARFRFLPETASIDGSPPLKVLDFGLSNAGFKLEIDSWTSGADHSVGCEDVNGASYPVLLRKGGNEYGSSVGGGADSSEGTSEKRLRKRLELDFEDVDSSVGLENPNEGPAARTLKRPRLVWTPQLHKRFVEAVSHLGIKNAVPKTIMQLMNVDGLTRENVASHLQKYRLYLKRMQGLSSEGPSVSDQLFASTPVPPGFVAPGHFHPNHGEDRFPHLVPMPMAAMGPTPMVGAPLGLLPPFSNVEQNLYNNLMRPSPSHTFHVVDRELGVDRTSSSKQVLTLFPTNET